MIHFKGFYSRDGIRYMGVEEAGIVYGFPADRYDSPDALLGLLQGVLLDNQLGSLEEAGFYPQSAREAARNVWERGTK